MKQINGKKYNVLMEYTKLKQWYGELEQSDLTNPRYVIKIIEKKNSFKIVVHNITDKFTIIFYV